MKLVEIKNSNFNLQEGHHHYRRPKNFKWIETNNPVTQKTFVTDTLISTYNNGIAWLIKPPVINPYPYNWLENNYDK